MDLTHSLIAIVERNPNGVGLTLIGLAAMIEYLFPPFPGDAIVVFGAFLATRRGWSPVGVFAAVLLGSAVGCMIDYYVGRALGASEERWTGRWARLRPGIDRVVERFRRHGALYICLNRFLPSVRALFFLAAGMARIHPLKVLGAGLLSAAAWNALLFALGRTVGGSWERLHTIFQTYGLAASAVVALVAAIFAIRWWVLRRRTRG